VEGDVDLNDPIWMQVIYIPPSLAGWEPSNDYLDGTEIYGDQNDHTKAWGQKFSDVEVTLYKIESVDK